jgi:ADP-heptose:LPS heptosyltransferase
MEENFIAEIERRLPIESRAILFKGKLEDMIKVITHSRLTVANDCGPAHLAQMVGVPFASVWGNLDNNAQKRIAEWFYTRPHSTYIVAGTNESIKSISPESVYAATQAIQ